MFLKSLWYNQLYKWQLDRQHSSQLLISTIFYWLLKCFISRQVLGKTSSYSEGYCFDFDMGLSDEYEISLTSIVLNTDTFHIRQSELCTIGSAIVCILKCNLQAYLIWISLENIMFWMSIKYNHVPVEAEVHWRMSSIILYQLPCYFLSKVSS